MFYSLSNDKLIINGLPGFVEEGQLGVVDAEEQEEVLDGGYPSWTPCLRAILVQSGCAHCHQRSASYWEGRMRRDLPG